MRREDRSSISSHPLADLGGLDASRYIIGSSLGGCRDFPRLEVPAMRFHPAAEAKRLRRIHQGTVFVAGLFIAAFLSIPVVSLATPLFGIAFMVHIHKRLTRRVELTAGRH